MGAVLGHLAQGGDRRAVHARFGGHVGLVELAGEHPHPQVVSQTWAASVTEDQKQGFIEALTGLGAVPDVASIRAGADAGLFEGNYDVVSVLDFADLASARRYVEHPNHQAFLATWSRPYTDKRVVVQHEWGLGTVAGLHHLKLPVTDVVCSRQCDLADPDGIVVRLYSHERHP